VSFDVELGYPAKSQMPALRSALIAAARTLPGVGNVSVQMSSKVVAHAAQRGVQLLPKVKNIVAVASGKGGVGKSTTTVNLALALAAEGASVGILDADIYGPSQPMMMGIEGRPESPDGKTMEALENYGVQVMSIGFLVDADNPMIWRGPMATQALEQLLRQTNWRELDYLLVDMPPGTGDIQLTLSQRVPLTGAVIVTTPQDIALLDAKKGLKMFEKVGVPILGIVENMAVYCCPNCGHTEHIFGADGGKQDGHGIRRRLPRRLPLNLSIREQADSGRPTVVADPTARSPASTSRWRARWRSRSRQGQGLLGQVPDHLDQQGT
jgi:ATP-binding protein involved in chromosome partitioning